MGLPLFREGDHTNNKRTANIDPTISARSSIRRSRSARHPRIREYPRIPGSSSRPRSSSRSPSRTILELIRSNDRNLNRTETAQDEEDRRLLEHGRAVLRESFNFEAPTNRLRRIRVSSLSPFDNASSSTDNRQDHETRRRRDEINGPRPHHPLHQSYIPSPPHSQSESSTHRRTPIVRVPVSFSGLAGPTAHLTPRFAPAFPLEHSPEPIPSTSRGDSSRNDNPADLDNSLRQLPPLRRMASRRITDGDVLALTAQNSFSRPVIDGLGDRERSPDDNWDTLLTTITPDANLPSADSSFTSAAASFPSTNPSRSLSRNTSTAPTSTNELLSPFHNCDVSDTSSNSSDSDAESTDSSSDILDYLFDSRPSVEISQTQLISQMRSGRLRSQLRRQRQDSRDVNAEYDHMHEILDHIAFRQDIPEDLWAAAGLTREFGERLERVLERTRY
ncbi:MAG: hypothetical protein M1834_009126 [Cirrosporium novae-zelandiae]|nr:MAG: hypothetical protein M1834_009126 [Cirrosporium novae-zelandiae]